MTTLHPLAAVALHPLDALALIAAAALLLALAVIVWRRLRTPDGLHHPAVFRWHQLVQHLAASPEGSERRQELSAAVVDAWFAIPVEIRDQYRETLNDVERQEYRVATWN